MPATTQVMDRRGVPIAPQPAAPPAALPGAAGDEDLGSPRVWRRVVESRAWPVVLDLDADDHVAALLAGQPQGFCARLGAPGFEPPVLDGAERALGWTTPWALVLEVAPVTPLFLADAAARLPTYLLDLRTDRLVRLPGGNGRLVDAFLAASWLETEACVVANTAAAHDLLEAP
jgi:hypothetical protein